MSDNGAATSGAAVASDCGCDVNGPGSKVDLGISKDRAVPSMPALGVSISDWSRS